MTLILSFMSKLIFNLINIFFKITNLLIIIIKLFLNIKKIIRTEKVVIFFEGGFGHQIIIPVIFEHLYPNEKRLIINLLQDKRHNFFLNKVTNTSFINLNVSKNYMVFGKKIEFGFIENRDNFIKFFIQYIIGFLIKHNNVITKFELYWRAASSILPKKDFKNYNEILYTENISNIFYYIIKNRSKNFFDLNYSFSKKFTDLISNRDRKKIVNLYLRKKDGDESSVLRNAENFESYIPLINYLTNNNFLIFLNGDYNIKKNFEKEIINKDLFFNYDKKAKDRQEYEIFSFLNSGIFIGNQGGARLLAAYSDLKIGLDIFPPKDFFFNEKVLYKKIYFVSEKRYLDDKEINDYKKYSNLKIENNSSENLIKFVKLKINNS